MPSTTDSSPHPDLVSLPAILFIVSLETFAQSYVALKLVLLVIFLVASTVRTALGMPVVIYPRLTVFYLSASIAAVAWSILGLWHGNYPVGVTEAVRLYLLWSLAFLLLYSILRSQGTLRVFHHAMVASGILIAAINLFGLADQIWNWGLIPDAVRQNLELRIGIHDGYIQITSNNVASLFLIIPYLLSLQLRADAGTVMSRSAKLSLALSLFLAAVSGRRALWLVVAVAPFMVLAMAWLTRQSHLLSRSGKRALSLYGIVAIPLGAYAFSSPQTVAQIGYGRHLEAAFSAQDERSIQKGYLVDAFAGDPVFGSGFGGYAGYTRSEDRPWTYELTYEQMLYNLGAVGMSAVGVLFCVYVVLVLGLLRRFPANSAVPFGLLLAFFSLLVGAYSNPYLGSFDFLFFVGLLPYLSTFRNGFDACAFPSVSMSDDSIAYRANQPSIPV